GIPAHPNHSGYDRYYEPSIQVLMDAFADVNASAPGGAVFSRYAPEDALHTSKTGIPDWAKRLITQISQKYNDSKVAQVRAIVVGKVQSPTPAFSIVDVLTEGHHDPKSVSGIPPLILNLVTANNIYTNNRDYDFGYDAIYDEVGVDILAHQNLLPKDLGYQL